MLSAATHKIALPLQVRPLLMIATAQLTSGGQHHGMPGTYRFEPLLLEHPLQLVLCQLLRQHGSALSAHIGLMLLPGLRTYFFLICVPRTLLYADQLTSSRTLGSGYKGCLVSVGALAVKPCSGHFCSSGKPKGEIAE